MMNSMRVTIAAMAMLAASVLGTARAQDVVPSDPPARASRATATDGPATPIDPASRGVQDVVRTVAAESDSVGGPRSGGGAGPGDPDALSAALDRAPPTCSAARILAVAAVFTACTASNRCSVTQPIPADRGPASSSLGNRSYCKVNRLF